MGRLEAQPARYILDKVTKLYLSYEQPPKPTIHEVKKDENLLAIAQRYDTTYQKIASLNSIENPNLIFVGQKLLMPQKESAESTEIILQGTLIPLGGKVNIIAEGTKNTKATVKVLADGVPFRVLKEGEEVTQFDVTLDQWGRSVTPVVLRPKSDDAFEQLIKDFMPQLGQDIKTEKLTLKAEIKKTNYESSLETDDMNTVGLMHFNTFIREASIIDPNSGRKYAALRAVQQGDDIVFYDASDDEPVASTSVDSLLASLGILNDSMGGVAKGMEYKGGTFALKNSKGIYLKHYENGWRGNGPVKTYSMSKWGGRIGKGTLGISIAIGSIQTYGAYRQDTEELRAQGVELGGYIDAVGQRTEVTGGSAVSNIVGGALGVTLAVAFLPIEAPAAVIVGTMFILGGLIGWGAGKLGEIGVETAQEYKGSTLINDYELKALE